MKQFDLFGVEKDTEKKYTKKIEVPIYEPKNKKPFTLELYDNTKTKRLINEIQISNVSESEKDFLIEAAKRHIVFNYSKIADYYSHSSKEMQVLMEKSALVIIDFEDAIQYGYAKLNDKLTQTYLNEPENEK
jgi:hypothetical protein